MKKKIAAIDIGTTKVCTIMGVLDSTSGLRVLGVGIAPSHGIEKALVADAAKAKESIRESIRKAEVMAGYKLESAYIGVTGRHITSMNSKGTIAITRSGYAGASRRSETSSGCGLKCQNSSGTKNSSCYSPLLQAGWT